MEIDCGTFGPGDSKHGLVICGVDIASCHAPSVAEDRSPYGSWALTGRRRRIRLVPRCLLRNSLRHLRRGRGGDPRMNFINLRWWLMTCHDRLSTEQEGHKDGVDRNQGYDGSEIGRRADTAQNLTRRRVRRWPKTRRMRQKRNQAGGNRFWIGLCRRPVRQRCNQRSQSLRRGFARQKSQFGSLLPRIDVRSCQRRNYAEQHSISLLANRRE
jgi:hypothetical protein